MKDMAIALLICVWINGWVCNVAAEGPAYHSCFLPQFCLNWETCLHNIFCLCSLGSPDSKSDLFFFWQCMMLETNCGRATSNPQFRDVPCGCLSFLKKRYGLQRLQVPASSASFWSDKQVLRSDVCFMSGRAGCMSHTSVFEIRVAADCSSQHKVGAADFLFIFFLFLCPSVLGIYFILYSNATGFWYIAWLPSMLNMFLVSRFSQVLPFLPLWWLLSHAAQEWVKLLKWLIASSKGVVARDSSPFLLAKETWLIQASFA